MGIKRYTLLLLLFFFHGLMLSQNQNNLVESEFNQRYPDSLLINDTILNQSNGKYSGGSINGPGQNCNNMDFETGNTTGWSLLVASSNNTNVSIPGSFFSAATNNYDYAITSGAGTDPNGGFPVVFSGNYSLRLGNINNSAPKGFATRAQQTFSVTTANAKFTYNYAVVLNIPSNDGSHQYDYQKPRFIAELVDGSGVVSACSLYSVTADASATGFSFAPGSNSTIQYKPWTTVILDLTPFIGQNVTVRFTAYDCAPSGHFGYAYIDSYCDKWDLTAVDTVCVGSSANMCALQGLKTYTWVNGGGVQLSNNQCYNTNVAGSYSCFTTLYASSGSICNGPTFTHTIVNRPAPVFDFTTTPLASCSKNFTFTNGMTSIPYSGLITSWKWSFGDNNFTTNPVVDPTHNYATAGTYSVKLKGSSAFGCSDSITKTVIVYPTPTVAFNPPSYCVNAAVPFANTSSVTAPSSIIGYTWNLAGGSLATSNATNPVSTYTNAGTYTITLDAITDQGCTSTKTQTLGILPPPILSFTAQNKCDVNGTAFTADTYTDIAWGSISTYTWNFGDGQTSNAAIPVHNYAGPNSYTVSFAATSAANCTAAVTSTFYIAPSPSVALASTSITACDPQYTFDVTYAQATNTTALPFVGFNYYWDFGNGVGTATNSPNNPYTFPSTGSYTVKLIGVSEFAGGVFCADTAVNYVTVYPYPNVNINIPSKCENASFAVITNTAAGSGVVATYDWDFGDGTPHSSQASPTHVYSVFNTYSVTLSTVSDVGCMKTFTNVITSYPNPVVAFTYSTLNNCSLPYTYLNTSSVAGTAGSSIVSYTWDFGGTGTSNAAQPGTVNFPSNGSYTLSLTAATNYSCVSTTTANILVHPLPDISFTTDSRCFGQDVPIASSASISPIPLSGSSMSYTWNFGDNTTTGAASPLVHTYTASGTYTISFTAMSNMGCVSSVSQAVDVWPVPVADFTTNLNVCLGNVSTFANSSSIAFPGAIIAYAWDFGDGGLGTGIGSGSAISHSYSTVGSYSATYIAYSDQECIAKVTKTIAVLPIPTVSFTTNGGCLNTTSNFIDNSTITGVGNSITAWNWNFGDGSAPSNSVIQNPNHTYANFGTFTPTLTLTSNFNCTNSAVGSVTIFPLPVISISPPNVCEGASIQFTNNSSVATGTVTSYTWDFADGTPTVSTSVPTHTYILAGSYVPTVTVVSDKGCTTTNTANVSIYPYPQGTVTPINNSCINDLASINTNVSITSGAVASHTLSYGDGGLSVSTATAPYIAAHTYTAYNTYTITLNAMSNNGCARTFTNSLVVYPKPFVSFNANNFCLHDVTSFTNTSVIPPGYNITSHDWSFGDATPNSSLASVTHSYGSSGNYSVQLTEYSYIDPSLTCSSSTVKIITINPLPIPAFNSNTVCAGTATSFSNNSVGGVNWSWDFENVGVVNSSALNPTYTYTAAGTHTAELRAQNVFGCRDSILNIITVKANPTASFVTGNVCLNNQTCFTDLSLSGEPGAMTYSWNLSSTTSTTTQNPCFTYPTANTYTVKLTVTNFSNCSNAFINTVTVYPLPNISFNAPDVCYGTIIQFTNNASIASGSIVNKQWDFGNSNTSTVSVPTYSYPVDGSYNVTLTAISDQGCVKTFTDDVTVHPVADATLFPINNTCINDQASINTNISISTGGVPSNTLIFGDGAQTVTNSPTYIAAHTYTAYNTYTITLNTKSNYGCTKIYTTSISVYPKPFVNFTSNNYCYNDSTLFVSTSSIPSPYSISNITWSFGDANTATFSPVNHKYSAPGTYYVTLIALNYINTGLTCSSSLTKSVVIHPLPTPIFTANTVCEGLPTLFTNSSTGGTLWQWDLYNNSLLTSPFYTLGYTYPSSGTYTVKLKATNSFSCSNTATGVVTVLAKPTTSFTANEVCLGELTLLNDASTPGVTGPLTYSWNVQLGSPIITSQNASNAYSNAGQHMVYLTTRNSAGCSSTYSANIVVNYKPNVFFVAGDACLGKPVQFTNLSSIPVGSITTWRWDFDNDSNWDDQTSFEPTKTYTSSGYYSCVLQAESDKGCTAALVVTVVVHDNPIADFSFPPRPCVGDNIQFTNLSSSPNGTITSYAWDFTSDGTIDNTTANPKNTFVVVGSRNVRLSVVTNFGCSGTITKTLYNNDRPKAVFSAERTNGCPPLCTKFISSSSITSGSIVTTEWDFGDGDVPSSGVSPIHCFNTGGYNVAIKLVSDSGCVTTFTGSSFITVYDPPKAGFDVYPDEIDEDEPNISVISSAYDAASAHYLVSDGSVFNTFDFNHTIKNLDIRTNPMIVQIVKSQYGCTDTTYKVLQLKPSFDIYIPDVFTPNGDGLNDVFQAKGVGIYKFNMRIFDRWGHLVFESHDIYDAWDGKAKGSSQTIKQDVYVWKADVMDIFGKTHHLSGHVTSLPDSGD